MPRHSSTFSAIGTRWTLDSDEQVSPAEWQRVFDDIRTYIDNFDKIYSRFRDDSLVSQIANQPGTYALPYDGGSLLTFYRELYDATDGKVTPLIGTLMNESGYDAAYSLISQPIRHSPPDWNEALTFDSNHITTNQPLVLDFGAAGKGFLIDQVAAHLAEAGIGSFVINAGGDMKQQGSTPITVGLEDPRHISQAIGTVPLHNLSLCASAGSRRKWEMFHHIIDPDSRTSPTDILATWVIARTTMLADGLATALFFTPANQLAQFDFTYAILHGTGELEYSADFPVTLFGDPS